LYVGAFQKRGTAYGPGGPGMIYRIDVATNEVSQWLSVPNVGTDRHDPSDDYWPDTSARNLAGIMSLGDIDLSPDESELAVMNLYDRKIYRYRVDDKAFLGTIELGSSNETWANQARPFALKSWNGKLYHGLVHSAYASQDPAELQAYVYETNPDGSSVRLVMQAPLDFDRGDAVQNLPARWLPWKDGYNAIGPGQLGVYPQPILADIEFADNGDMILGFRDRNGDMTFFNPGGQNPPGEGTAIPAGDIVIARFNGSTWDPEFAPEFFEEDYGPNRNVHDETGFGGLARVETANIVITMGLAPLRISSGGGYWFDMDSGDNTGREELYAYDSTVNFGKANGLGDVELVCQPQQATETPTATATATSTTPSTETATVTATPQTPTVTATVSTATVTSSSTPLPTLTPTLGPSPTAGPTDEEDEEESTPVAAQPTELPKLPSTGRGGSAGGLSLVLAALALLATALVLRLRRPRSPA
jgi:hypothetical protein